MEKDNPLRGAEYRQMLLEILDDRAGITDAMKQKAQKINLMFSGYTSDAIDLPSFVDLPRGMDPKGASVDVVAHKDNGKMVLDSITISPQDSMPIILKDDKGLMLRQIGEDVSLLPRDALKETLYSFFPHNVRYKLTIEKALDVIEQLSPTSDIIYEFQDDQVDFLSTVKVAQSEKIDDSVFSVEVVKTVIHPSGQVLGTRMNMTESMKRHSTIPDSTEHGVSMDVENGSSPITPLFFESLDNTKTVAVAYPTRRHVEDVLEVLDRLNQYSFDSPNPGAA